MFYLISGVFFQQKEWLIPSFGSDLMIASGLLRTTYIGAIGPSEENKDGLAGAMYDRSGDSQLSEITMTESEFAFIKQYAT